MYASWKKSKTLKPDVLLEEIKAIASVDKDGSVNFSGFEYYEHIASLHMMVSFKSPVVWPLRQSAIRRALTEIIRNQKVDRDSFITEVNAALKRELATRELPYTVLTSVSLSGTRVLKTLDVLGCKIRFLPGEFPKKYASRQEQEKNFDVASKPTPPQYQKVIITTKARNSHEAMHKCLRSLDMVRALCCLFLNPRMQIQWGPENKPLNTVVLGGLHSLHKGDGSLHDKKHYWYEPYQRPPKPKSVRKDQARVIRNNIKVITKTLNQSKYGDHLVEALLRYVRALDESDENAAALKLWGALESLSIEPHETYDALVRRCSFVVADPAFHRQNLEALREYRNSNVHAGEYSEQARTYCFQMQFYFYALFRFHIGNCKYFPSMNDAKRFLDLPPGLPDLQRRRELIEKAIQFVTPKE